MSAIRSWKVLLPMAFIFAWLLAITEPAYALGTPQIVSINPGSGSPVGSNVCIKARVDTSSDYRAMRIRFGNEGWQESSEYEFERCFVTGHLNAGWYTIRVEVAAQGDNSWSNPTSTEASYELTAPPQPPAPPKGPGVDFSFSPSGGANVGDKVNVHVKVYSSNPGAIRIYVPCGGIAHFEHTVPEYDTTWDTGGCGAGSQTVRVCARDVNDPNWANPTCTERSYTLSAPPVSVPQPTVNFWSDAATIQSGQCTWLHWTTSNANVVDIDGTVVASSSDLKVCPTVTKHYSLKAQGDGGVATRSLSIVVSAQPPPPSVTDKFQTGDIIQIGYDVFVIVNGERRLVPNPDTLDALGIPRSWIDNKGFGDSDLKTIPRGTDIPDVNRDYSGFTAFKSAYFPNTVSIVPATSTPTGESGKGPVAVNPTATPQNDDGQQGTTTNNWYVAADPAPTTNPLADLIEPLLDFFSSETSAAGPELVPRADFADSKECTGYVANTLCRDALYWLDYDAYAYRWLEMAYSERAKSLGVLVYTTPRSGDIAVWDQGCGDAHDTWGHVAYVTSVNGNRFDVKESNWNDSREIGVRRDVEVLPCMRFIRNACNIPDELLNPPEPEQPKGETELTYPSWLPDWLRAAYDWLLRRSR